MDIPGFENWGRYVLDSEPRVLHDLNGQPLFYDFIAMDRRKEAGVVRASASKTLGSGVRSIQLGPHKWNPTTATRESTEKITKLFPKAEIVKTEFVCYCYPKIGVRVYFDDPTAGKQSRIFDVASLSMVENYADIRTEGFAAYSYYDRVIGKDTTQREALWDVDDQDVDIAIASQPNIVNTGFTAAELPKIKDTFRRPIPEYFPTSILTGTRVLPFSPRCSPHKPCFELYAQQTDVYCAVATGQMILDFYRWYYTQDEIAAAMSTGASGTTNTNQVAGYESLSKKCLDATYDGSADWSEAWNEIGTNRPLKSGVDGHARACCGAMFDWVSIFPFVVKHYLRIYDPWPWNADICQGGAIYWEDWDSEFHTNFIYVRHRTTACD
jgi:hypothetical protein